METPTPTDSARRVSSDSKNASLYGVHYVIKVFAASLFSIFIPIYLYVNGFSLVQVGSFYLLQEIFNLSFTYFLYRKIFSIGLRNVLIIAVLSQIILILFVYNYLAPLYAFLLALSFIHGLHDSFYWGANETMLVHLSGKNVGKFLGTWSFVVTLLQVVTIPLSGYILDHYSPFWLVVLSVIFLLLSLIPLTRIKLSLLENNSTVPLKNLVSVAENRYLGTMSHLNEFLTKVSESILPLYVFILFANYFSVGIAGSFSVIGAAIYSYFVGTRSEESEKRKTILFFNIFACLLSIVLIMFIQSKSFIFILVAAVSFFRLGTYISSMVGMNKLCLTSDCYARKMFGRMMENLAGISIGVCIILSGLIGFQNTLYVIAIYIVVMGASVYRFRDKI